MSKRDLKKYVIQLTKEQLEEQIIELYDKFSAIKTYYDFVFNPKEELLMQECKMKISNEYFPKRTTIKLKKPKMRRSVAQKYIKHFILLGVDPFIIGDIMLYAIEVAQDFSSKRNFLQDSFFKSMFNSYQQAIKFMIANGILNEFLPRIVKINQESLRQDWFNKYDFETVTERLEELRT